MSEKKPPELLTVTQGTALSNDLMRQLAVSNSLSELVAAPTMCVHTMRAVVESMTDEPPEGAMEMGGVKLIPMAMGGMDLIGIIIWDDDEPRFVPILRSNDPIVKMILDTMMPL